jgi:hypothetical protein
MQASVRFGLGIYHDDGNAPSSVAMNLDNLLVEVHETNTVFSDDLRFSVGTVSDLGVSWGSISSHTKGSKPDIAMAISGGENTLIEVHEDNGKLYYSAGIVNKQDKTIKWWSEGGNHWAEGHNPGVALDSKGTLVTVYRDGNKLYYAIGALNISTKKVSFGKGILLADDMNDDNATPSVSVNENGIVLVAYQTVSFDLFYYGGIVEYDVVTSGMTIKWKSKGVFDSISSQSGDEKRKEPSVSINNNGLVVITSNASGKLYEYNGSWESNGLSISGPISFDSGETVRVASNDTYAVESHSDGSRFYYSMSLFIDRANWMGSNAKFLEYPLWKLTLPATHDSCTYDFYDQGQSRAKCSDYYAGVTSRVSCQAQQDTMLQQLNAGVRYVDIRVCKNQDEDNIFYTYHSLIAVKVENVLNEIAEFLAGGSKELLVVNFTHLCCFEDDDHKKLIDMIKATLGQFLNTSLLPSMPPKDVYSQSIRELTCIKEKDGTWSQAANLIIVYQDDYFQYDEHPDHNKTNYILRNPEMDFRGFIASLGVYDSYANTYNFDEMQADQLTKMKDKAPQINVSDDQTPENLFLLSWTLTGRGLIGQAKELGNLHDLSKEANRQLSDFLLEYVLDPNTNKPAYQLGMIYVDFYNDARAVDFSYLLNLNR